VTSVRIGIVGAGLMGRELTSAAARWIHMLDVDFRPEIIAVCDVDTARLEWFAERVVPRDQLYATALELANVIAAKSPIVMRRAKESLNMIDPVDVKRSYRFEQGFTFELNLLGDSDELRQAFVDKRDAELD